MASFAGYTGGGSHHDPIPDDEMRVYYAQALFGQEEIDAVNAVLKNEALTLMDGPSVKRFEQRVAQLFGKPSGLMVNSGSSANMLALAALDLPKGSEIITPALTFSTTVAPIIQQGLTPAFVDVEPDTYCIDAERVEAMISPRTRALMVPNLIGNLPDWRQLRAIADRHGLAVVEDSADTIGSQVGGTPTGRLTDISTTSFYASHVVTCAGFGGAVSFNDEALAQRARLLRGWGRASSVLGESESIDQRFNIDIDGIPYDAKFVFDGIGYNFLPSEIGAAFGLVQLDRLAEYTRRRRENFAKLRRYCEQLAEWFILPRQAPDTETAWLALPLIVRDDAPFTRRDLQVFLEQAGIQTRTVFTGNILRQPAFREIGRVESPDGYPNADRVMRSGILLGCHQAMTDDQLTYVCEMLDQFTSSW